MDNYLSPFFKRYENLNFLNIWTCWLLHLGFPDSFNIILSRLNSRGWEYWVCFVSWGELIEFNKLDYNGLKCVWNCDLKIDVGLHCNIETYVRLDCNTETYVGLDWNHITNDASEILGSKHWRFKGWYWYCWYFFMAKNY